MKQLIGGGALTLMNQGNISITNLDDDEIKVFIGDDEETLNFPTGVYWTWIKSKSTVFVSRDIKKIQKINKGRK